MSELHNPEAFYTALRRITGRLDERQVETINGLMSAAPHWPIGFMAYGMATAWHEARLAPIHELGGPKYLAKYDTGTLAKVLGNTPEADGDGVLYAGRGLVQLTGKTNYAKAGARLGIDLIANPDLALRPDVATRILVWGMETGAFTGRKLSNYMIDRGTHEAFIRCRRIINGTDKCDLIAQYADEMQEALDAGEWK